MSTGSDIQFIDLVGYEVSYRKWGQSGLPVVIAVHGMGGQASNFDQIGRQLASDFQVIALDLIGRGLSQWTSQPQNQYCFKVYEQIVLDFVDRLELTEFGWLGVSMGGALGIHMAVGSLRNRINALILNDIGFELDEAVASEIQTAVQVSPRFEKFTELIEFYRSTFGAFGMVESSKRSWKDMALASARRQRDGTWTLQFDPAVAMQLTHHLEDFQQMQSLSKLTAPILLFRGKLSTVLTDEHARQIEGQNSNSELIEIDGVGHAPLLDRDEDIAAIASFFKRNSKRAVT